VPFFLCKVQTTADLKSVNRNSFATDKKRAVKHYWIGKEDVSRFRRMG